MEKVKEIGRVKRVQVQRSSLKLGEKPHRIYDPAPLLVVDRLLLLPEGVIGLAADGGKLIDVHHAHHAQTRNSSGVNGVSIGFTSHYQDMRTHFGVHLADGCAGENILIESDRSIRLADLGQRLLLKNPLTGNSAYLEALMVAAPCVEFSHYAMKANLRDNPLPPEQVKNTLQFLDDGRRGFYATARQQAVVQPGDVVYAVML